MGGRESCSGVPRGLPAVEGFQRIRSLVNLLSQLATCLTSRTKQPRVRPHTEEGNVRTSRPWAQPASSIASSSCSQKKKSATEIVEIKASHIWVWLIHTLHHSTTPPQTGGQLRTRSGCNGETEMVFLSLFQHKSEQTPYEFRLWPLGLKVKLEILIDPSIFA